MLVSLARLLYATHDMSWTHVERWQRTAVDHRPPIHVEALPDGWLFVHDGRHRAEAAYDDGAVTIEAREVA